MEEYYWNKCVYSIVYVVYKYLYVVYDMFDLCGYSQYNFKNCKKIIIKEDIFVVFFFMLML